MSDFLSQLQVCVESWMHNGIAKIAALLPSTNVSVKIVVVEGSDAARLFRGAM
jgi:hypothetical protein